jgi:hypothetical protein
LTTEIKGPDLSASGGYAPFSNRIIPVGALSALSVAKGRGGVLFEPFCFHFLREKEAARPP